MGTQVTTTLPVSQVGMDWDSPLRIHPLSYLDEGGEITVGRMDTGSYCILPPDGAALLRELGGGTSPRRAAAWYVEEFGEPVDMSEFLLAMQELGFLVSNTELGGDRATDGRAGGQSPTSTGRVGRHERMGRGRSRSAPRHRRRFMRWQRLGIALFSPMAWLGYLVVIAAAITLMVGRPELTPHYGQLFFTPYLTVLELVLFLGQFPFLILHEMFHALAGRRLGLPSSFHVGRRLYYVVLETSLDGLVGVPRTKRYLPMLAGMLADLLVIATLTLIAASLGTSGGALSPLGAVCLALAFGTVLRFVWQFYFFLHTDLYYVVTTVFGCVNLQQTSRQMLANRARRLLGRRDRMFDESTWHPRDRAVARWYSWLLLIGYTVAVVVVPLVAIPTMIRVAGSVVENLSGHQSTVGAVDGIAFLSINLAQIALVAALIRRDRRRRRLSPPTHLIG